MTSEGVGREGLQLLRHAIRLQPRLFAVSVGAGVLFSLCTVGSAYLVGEIIGRVVEPSLEARRVDGAALAVACVAITGVGLGKALGLLIRRVGATAMQLRLQATYRRAVVRRYLRLPISWHHRHRAGTLISNANADVEAAWASIAPLPFAVGTVVMLATAVIGLLMIDWMLAVIGIAVIVTLLLLNLAYSRRIAPRMATAQRLRAELSAMAHESLDGAVLIKLLGQETEQTRRFEAISLELRDALVAVGRVRGLFDPLLTALPSLGTIGVLVVGGWRMQQGVGSLGEIVGAAFLFTVMGFPVVAIGQVFAELPHSVAGWRRVRWVLTAGGDPTYGQSTGSDTEGPAGLTVDSVTFSYVEGRPILHDVTFEIPAGGTVALVGPTGAGKSTVAMLAARLVDPDAGVVSVDGVDVRKLTRQSARATVAITEQVPFVFDDTIRGNVGLDRTGLGEDELREALRLAQADAFVAALPAALDTMVGERGVSLSGGQRQRIALARALAGRPRLVVLDDATSAVDPRVEAAIFAALRANAERWSVLVIACRRAPIALADHVVYLEHGRVVAQGGHAHLMDSVQGYAELITAYERAEVERDRERDHARDDRDASV